jgi:hypothetical protein
MTFFELQKLHQSYSREDKHPAPPTVPSKEKQTTTRRRRRIFSIPLSPLHDDRGTQLDKGIYYTCSCNEAYGCGPQLDESTNDVEEGLKKFRMCAHSFGVNVCDTYPKPQGYDNRGTHPKFVRGRL